MSWFSPPVHAWDGAHSNPHSIPVGGASTGVHICPVPEGTASSAESACGCRIGQIAVSMRLGRNNGWRQREGGREGGIEEQEKGMSPEQV